MRSRQYTGVLIAILIICLWSGSLTIGLTMEVDYTSPWLYLLILLQTHLYTGLFITAHDAMHGTVSRNRKVNTTFGHITALLFSFNFYHRLFPKHHEHHRFVATEKDPDYHEGGFLPWYFSFLKQYVSWQQIVLMAITFNLLKLAFPVENLILLWMLPGVLATFQLFYFGTYLPHKGAHSDKNKHFSRSQSKNHLWAFLTCYFFGYHYEHHDSPGTPWWQLHKKKEQQQLQGYPK
jgi:beta-carotene ketolase (CrtW type)